MHFEMIGINNLKRAEQRTDGKRKQLVRASFISDSRHDVIFSPVPTHPKKKNRFPQNSENANADGSLETTSYYSPRNGEHAALWLSTSCANVQAAPPQVKAVSMGSCAGAA